MKSSKQVFFSFKSEEVEYAKMLVNALTDEEFDVWYDEKIQISQEWHGEIDKALEAAGAVVVLWSQKSVIFCLGQT